MKIDLSGVSETLLVTLYMRAKDAKSNHPFLNDRKAAEIISCMDYDFSAFDRVWMSYYGVLARAKLMDREVKRFMADNPGCVVVSVGCGLDTRFDRVDDGQVRWYDLDVPEVIDLRKQFLAESERVTCISGSAFDPSWTEKVEREGRRLPILSEGVMMYWEEAEVQKFLSILSEGFDELEAHFDLLYKGLVHRSSRHDVLKRMQAEFKWGVTDGSEVVRLAPAWKQLDCINFTDEMRHMLPGWKKLLVPFFYLTNNRLGKYAYRKYTD